MQKRSDSVCFIANDAKFFFRHFRPAVAAAEAAGARPIALLPVRDGDRPFNSKISVVPSPIDRRTISPPRLVYQAIWLLRQLRKLRPQVVVAYSLRASFVMALAVPFAKVPKVVFSITGLGAIDLVNDAKSRFIRRIVYSALRAASRHENCHFIFENSSDASKMGFAVGQPARQTILVGAGVDPAEFPVEDFPASPPYKFATVSRLIWSKGIDLAARAISELAQEGYAVELNVFGSPDEENPFAVDLDGLSKLAGVQFRGHSDNVADVWRHHHAAVFASRGGEGLPRALIEAASCGRPSVVTDVSGCNEFVRDGQEGYVVAAESVPALKEAIKKLISDSNAMKRFGKLARDRVLATATSQLIQKDYERLFALAHREVGERSSLENLAKEVISA